jgi:hypothetical protein
MVMEAVNNMSADKQKKIDHEVKEIHTQIKRNNLVLRQRMQDLREEMEEWTLGGMNDGESEGYMQ